MGTTACMLPELRYHAGVVWNTRPIECLLVVTFVLELVYCFKCKICVLGLRHGITNWDTSHSIFCIAKVCVINSGTRQTAYSRRQRNYRHGDPECVGRAIELTLRRRNLPISVTAHHAKFTSSASNGIGLEDGRPKFKDGVLEDCPHPRGHIEDRILWP